MTTGPAAGARVTADRAAVYRMTSETNEEEEVVRTGLRVVEVEGRGVVVEAWAARVRSIDLLAISPIVPRHL